MFEWLWLRRSGTPWNTPEPNVLQSQQKKHYVGTQMRFAKQKSNKHPKQPPKKQARVVQNPLSSPTTTKPQGMFVTPGSFEMPTEWAHDICSKLYKMGYKNQVSQVGRMKGGSFVWMLRRRFWKETALAFHLKDLVFGNQRPAGKSYSSIS